MSFVKNDRNNEQLSLRDPWAMLSEREKQFLEKSWARYFADYIFPKIDETPYAVLYSKKDSRPNTPVNVQIGALIIKEYTGQSDDDLLASLMFDIRYRYALHTTGYAEQPMSDRTLGRFRERCNAYELESGIDLLHNTIESLASELATMMNIDRSLKRMDSMMVAANIKKLSRLELLYVTVSNLAEEVLRKEGKLPEELKHYTESGDRNLVIYHNKSDETEDKITKVLREAKMLEDYCNGNYDESSNFQLLIRVLREQAIWENGAYRLRTAQDGGMHSEILQNPSDPDATYREKAGKQHRGYAGNLVESAGENGSIVTDYQYETNNYSDSAFLKDSLDKMGPQENEVTIVADGAFSGKGLSEAAAENNVTLVNTNLTGKEPDEFLAGFELNEAENRVLKCPAGYDAKSCSYNEKTGQFTVSFYKANCEHCPLKEKCHPKEYSKTCRKTFSAKGKRRAEQKKERSTKEFKDFCHFRNGVEALPSLLRRKFHVDRIPARGKLRSRFFFGCKIGALNFGKFCRFLQSSTQSALPAVSHG